MDDLLTGGRAVAGASASRSDAVPHDGLGNRQPLCRAENSASVRVGPFSTGSVIVGGAVR